MHCIIFRLTEMEILYKKEKEEADQLLEQQRLVRLIHFDTSCSIVYRLSVQLGLSKSVRNVH